MIPRDKFTVKGLILDQSPILCLPTLVPPVTCREYWVDLPILANPFQIWLPLLLFVQSYNFDAQELLCLPIPSVTCCSMSIG